MSSTSRTRFEVNVYADGRWNLRLTTDTRKEALAAAEKLNKMGVKWSVWKKTERSEMLGAG